MSWPTFSVTITKMTRKPPHGVELRLTRCSPVLPMDLWPDLALRVLADPAGSPLREQPLYDEEWLAAHTAEFIGDVSVVSCRGDSATYQIPLVSDALAAVLKKDQTWVTHHFPTRWPLPVDGAWLPDEKALLVGCDNGLAQVFGVSKKGVGSSKSLLSHPGLVAVDASATALLTAGRTTVVRWDAAGKKALRSHTLQSPVVSARFLGDRIAVGCVDGAVLLVSADDSRQELAAPGAHGGGVVALAVGPSRLAVGFAGGALCEWDATGTVLGIQGDSQVVALLYVGDGVLAVGRSDYSIQVGQAAAVSLLKKTHHQLYHATLHPARQELFVADGGRVSAISWDGTTQDLAETGQVYDLQHSPSGQYRVARGRSPDAFYLWDAVGRLRWRLSDSIHPIGQQRSVLAVFSPDERWVAIQRRLRSHADGAVVILETEGGGSMVLPNANARYAWVESIAWLDDDRLLVSYSNEPDKVWRLSTCQYEIAEENNFSAQVARTDGGIAFCAPRSFEADVFRLLSPADLSVVATFPLEGLFGSSYPPAMQIAQSGRLALLSNPFQDIVLVTPDGEEPWRLPGSAGTFNDVLLSPSGRWMVVHRKDKQLEIWDVARRTCTVTVEMAYCRSIFSPDEESLFCLEGTQVRRLSLSSGAFSVVVPPNPGAHTLAPISAMLWMPDGRVAGLCGGILSVHLSPTRRGPSSRGGRTLLSPSQALIAVLTDRGPEVVPLHQL